MTQTVTRYPHGMPCWVGLNTHSLATSQEFYGKLFGWEFRSAEQVEQLQLLGPYFFASLNGRDVAGMGTTVAERHLPTTWQTYLATDDADVTAERIRYCGGTVGVGPLELHKHGRAAYAADPGGANFVAWQGRRFPGFGTVGGPGTQVWTELITRECSDVGDFYSLVFGLEAEEASWVESDYLLLRLGDRTVGGIRGVGDALPEDRGRHWMPYFEVADADEAVSHVTELGGRLLAGPMNSPYGRLAQVADPDGGAFSVIHLRRP